MKQSKVLKGFLAISGLLLTFIGGYTLFMPVAAKAGGGMDIAGNINLLNDVRASGALFLTMAIVTLSGLFSNKLAFTSILVSFLLFLSIGVGRAISILLDGMPAEALVKATGLEFVLGIAGAILFIIYREKA